MANQKKEIRRPSTRWSFYLRSAKETGVIRCAYCGAELHYEDAELDHVHPRALGGTNEPKNVVVACRKCNRAKSSRPVREFVRELALEMAWIPVAQAAPSGTTQEEFEAVLFATVEDVTRQIMARVRRERERKMPRAAGRLAALLNRTVKPNRAL